MISRRTFLAGAAPLLGVGAGSEPGQTPVRPGSDTSPTRSQFDPWIEVNAQNLRHNVAEVARLTKRSIIAVIKNNGYGLGVVNVARILEPLREVETMAVVKLDEAVRLRDAGIRKPILMMGPFTDDELEKEIGPRNIMPMVYRDHSAVFQRAASADRRFTVHVKIDTGMGRVGVPHEDAVDLIGSLRGPVRLAGVMTTLTEEPDFETQQLRRLDDIRHWCGRQNIDTRFHAASSYALFQNHDAFLDLVRPGMALFGIYSEPAFRRTRMMDLRPAVALRCRVALVKQLEPGESAGYNRAFIAREPTWIATLPVGHADGWPRAAAKGARVRIGAALYPVIASVSASHTIVAIGSQPSAAAGDVATLFDWTDGSRPEDVAEACGASVYDLAMHLSPLLPRRVV